jgi:glycosyltransferase involved in cell wall biosynthesis
MAPLDEPAPRLNVCVIGLRGVPGILGGVESHCEQLLPRLQALSPDYRISVVGRHQYLPAEQFEYKGVTVVPLPALRSKYFEAISNTALAVLYARFSGHARLLHIHNIGPALLGPVARLLGMKLVVTYHSRNYEHAKWNRVARAMLRLGERCAVAAAHKVIVISRSMTDDLKQRYPRAAGKFVFVPNGATEFPAPAGREEEQALLDRFGLEPGRYILAVGRLVPEKSFHTLIAAFKDSAALKELGGDFKLVIAGKADHEDAYSRSLLAEAGDRICFTGFQGHRELGILYRNASLFVLPSTHEGLPIAALEAASLGVPVLLSDIQPNLDIDLPADCYFPVGDIEALRGKILQPHAAYRIDHEGIARRFDWSLVARETKDIYAAVCAAN